MFGSETINDSECSNQPFFTITIMNMIFEPTPLDYHY